MATIYYPHLDLENKGLLQYPPDHILNIKLLTLLADDVLILSSHLLDADINQLHAIKDGLYDFIIDGKVKTVLYKGYGTLEEYLHHKTESLLDQTLRLSYQGKADYINARIFDHNSHLLSVNNEQEREQFHNIYVDTNLNKARQIGNRWLIHSALEFRDEVYKRRDQKATYLTLPEINQAIFDLMKAGRIKEPHYSFFLKNQVGTYYYCGSMANSAITAYNPYFESIQFDQITSQTGYHSTQAYDPAFLMHVLTSLDIIKDEDDIKALLSRDIDEIRRHWAWKDFQSLFSTLYEDTFIFSEFIEREKNFQKKVDFIKEFFFSVPLGLFSDFLLTPVIIGLPPGIVTVAVHKMLDYLVSNSRSFRLMRQTTIDRIIERLIASKEPLYVVTSRLKYVIERIMQR